MPTDLRAILAVVGILRWNLDDVDVGTLCWISGPPDGGTRPTDAQDDTVKEFNLGDKEMVKGLIPFSNLCSGIKDHLFILMEDVQCMRYLGEGAVINQMGLH